MRFSFSEMSHNRRDLQDSQAQVLLPSHSSRRWHGTLAAGVAVLVVANGSSAAESPVPRAATAADEPPGAAAAAEDPAPRAAANAAQDPAPRGVDWISLCREKKWACYQAHLGIKRPIKASGAHRT